MKKTLAHLLVLCIMVIFPVVSHGATYTWTTIDYPGAGQTQLSGIDGSTIIGNYDYDGHTGTDRAFLYDGATWTNLEYPGSITNHAFDVDGGNVVGSYTDGSSVSHGFIYNGSTWTALDYPGALSTLAISGAATLPNLSSPSFF